MILFLIFIYIISFIAIIAMGESTDKNPIASKILDFFEVSNWYSEMEPKNWTLAQCKLIWLFYCFFIIFNLPIILCMLILIGILKAFYNFSIWVLDNEKK